VTEMQYLEEGPLVAPKLAGQPVSHVTWIALSELTANDYNPNLQAPDELQLLAVSILHSGWTQPLVINSDMEIVDGFHRWTVAHQPEIFALTDGLVPVVQLHDLSPEEQRLATVRHNRARGTHHVLRMAELVLDLIDEHGLTEDDLKLRLGMSHEEVSRLWDRGDMLKRGSDTEFNKGWVPR
jgi:ParB-like chromosome segregation protein Spo0J